MSVDTRNAILSILVLASCASTASAQQPPPWIRGPVSSVLFLEHTPTRTERAFADTAAGGVRPTHWKQGLVIGGVAGAVGLGAVFYLLCGDLNENQGSCIGTGLGAAVFGAIIGGTVGALIGGQFPQHADTLAAPDSTATIP